jgi:alkylhydroperoxidase/carboxymuconolactone decarboxylase family protein YurZ
MIRDCELWWLKKLVEGFLKGHDCLNHQLIHVQINACKRVGCTDKEIEDAIASVRSVK